MMKKNSELKHRYKVLAVIAGIVTMVVILFIVKTTDKTIKKSQTIEEFYASKEGVNTDSEETRVVVADKKEVDIINIDPKIRALVSIEDKYTVYVNKNNPDVYEIIDDEELIESNLDIFTEAEVSHKSEDYSRITINEKSFLVSNNDISQNRVNIFRDVENEERFINKDTKLFVEPKENSLSVNVKMNEKVDLLGFNEMGFAKVNYKGDILFAKTDSLSEERIKVEVLDHSRAKALDNSRRNSNNANTQNTRSVSNNTNNNSNSNRTSQSFTTVGQTFNCSFSAYYPENSRLQGGFNDAMGNPLVPANNTCAAPKEIPFGTKILVQGTGTDKDGQVFTVTDRGGAIKMQADGTWRVDILTHNRDEAYGFGRRTGTVTIVE